MLSLLGFNTTSAQDSMSVENVKITMKYILAGGKLEREIILANSVYVRWRKGKQISEVYINRYNSEQIAEKAYTDANDLLDEMLNGRGSKKVLQGLGNDGVIYSEMGNLNECALSFRRNEFRLHINGLSRNHSMKMARRLDELVASW